jgi:ketosteroid isomerase-like protein
MKPATAAHLAVLFALGLAQAGCASRAAGRVLVESPADEAAIRKLEDEFLKAKVANDTAALARIVAEDYYGMNQNGNARNRTQLLELFKNFPMGAVDVDIERIRISGDNAVVAGRQRERCQGAGGGDNCRDIQLFLRTYVRRGGRWQVLTSVNYHDPQKGGPSQNAYAHDAW